MRGKTAISQHNCALGETSMKLGTVVDHDPNVENPMRTHLKTAPDPRSDDVIIRLAGQFFYQNLNQNISN